MSFIEQTIFLWHCRLSDGRVLITAAIHPRPRRSPLARVNSAVWFESPLNCLHSEPIAPNVNRECSSLFRGFWHF